MTGVQRDLIFDIGMHKGIDSQYYLAKGFRVVGVEAVPALCRHAATVNADDLARGTLVIVERALFHESGQRVKFYCNPEKDDWGSLYRGAAEKAVGQAEEIQVLAITLDEIIDAHGVPYYAKCDIEGGDAIFVSQLATRPVKPHFVSVELTSLEDLAALRIMGYDRFQIVNQWLNPFNPPPNPSLEGRATPDVRFTSEMSGPFGRDLPPVKWTTYDECVQRFVAWNDLRLRDAQLGLGWLDVHVTTDAVLANPVPPLVVP